MSPIQPVRRCLLLGVLLTASVTRAQWPDLRFQSIESDRLPEAAVHAVTQDSSGFLWIGTSDGLYRHDGYGLLRFDHRPDDPSTISASRIRALFEDSRGVLWVGSNGGLDRYRPESRTFEPWLADGGLPHPAVTSLAEDGRGRLWVGTKGGLLVMGTDRRPEATFGVEDGLSSEGITGIVVMGEEVWVSTHDAGLNRWRGEREFETYRLDLERPGSLPSDRLNTIYGDRQGRLWIGTYDRGLARLDPGTDRFVHYPKNLEDPRALQVTGVKCILQDEAGAIWVGTWSGGLSRLEDDGGFSHFRHDPDTAGTLADDRVLVLFQDRSGQVRVGTHHGLETFDPGSLAFTRFRTYPGRENSLVSNAVLCLTEDHDGRLWIGTYYGLSRWDPDSGVYTGFQANPDDPTALPNSGIFDLETDHEGTVWIGTGKGLQSFDASVEEFRTHGGDDDAVVELLPGSRGEVWVNRWEAGPSVLRPGSDRFEPVEVSLDSVEAMHESSDGTIWFGGHGGVVRLDPDGDAFQLVPAEDPSTELHVVSFFETADGRLWAGSPQGLVLVDGAAGRLGLPGRDGRPDGFLVAAGLSDRQGRFWMSSDRGIARLDAGSGEVTWFDEQDGLPAAAYASGAGLRGADGRLYFGGRGGVVAFHPEGLARHDYVPPVVLTGFRLFNQPVAISADSLLRADISTLDAMTLDHTHSVIAFEFSALNYRQPHRNRYAYRLLGFDDDWLQTDASDRKAVYTKLPHGTYTFQVRASNDDGVWNDDGASLRLVVLPPPWKTWWAYTLYGLAAMSAIAGVVGAQRRKFRHKQRELERERALTQSLEEANEKLREFDRLKDDFLASTSHELRTPLNGIIGMADSLLEGAAGELSEKARRDLALVVSSGKRLSSLVDDILDFSKLKHHEIALDAQPVDLQAATSLVIELIRPLLGTKSLTLESRLPEGLPPVLADENRLQQILYNLLGNAIKFTDSGRVEVLAAPIGEGDEAITVTIADTGPGIPLDQQERIFESFEQGEGGANRTYGGTGIGLAVTRQLVELHGGRIWVESSPGAGARFSFTLPRAEGEIGARHAPTDLLVRARPDLPEVEETSPRPSRPNGMRILIVDDEVVNLRVLSNHLTVAGYEVVTASGGDEALAAIEARGPFHLVILDIMMPRMTGYQVCRQIRERHPPQELPVIMLTAKNRVTDVVEGFDSGANDYLVKPFSRDELDKRLEMHLGLARVHQATSRFVPQEFLQTLHRDSITDVRLGDQIHGDMTVLFSDIRSYTTLAETMSPEENFGFLNRYLSQVGPEIEKHRGFINQYYGDGIMAIFPGLPDDALTASVRIQEVVRSFSQERASRGREPIRVGVGVHTGPLMLGIIGYEERMDAGVVADTVNAASRLEGLTRLYGSAAVVSQEVLDRSRDRLLHPVRFLDRVRVKGRSQVMEVFELLDAEPPELRELKQSTLQTYQKGLAALADGRFAEARELFETVLAASPDDGASRHHHQRCRDMLDEGVPEDWDGILTLDTK